MKNAGSQAHDAHRLTGSQALTVGAVNAAMPKSDLRILTSGSAVQVSAETSNLNRIFEWSFLRFFIAAILLSAAWLKWQSFGTGRASFLAEIAPQLEWMLIQAELVVGVWLVVGWFAYYGWLASLLMFGSFVGASLVMTWQGRSSCGCLGAIEFNPWWMFLFDLAIVGLLLRANGGNRHIVGAPLEGAGRFGKNTAHMQFLIAQKGAMGAVVFSSAILGALAVQYSPVIASTISDKVPPQLSGQFLVASPAIVDVGQGTPNQWRTISIQIANRSDQKVTLIGAEQGCRCRAIKSLPIEIPAYENVEIEVDVRLGQKPGLQQDRFWLMTSHQQQSMLICRWRSRIEAER
jgi:hypothetical protein